METLEYDASFVHVFSKVMEHEVFIQYSLRQGLKGFGEKDRMTALKEMNQLHLSNCFKQLGIEEIFTEDKKKALGFFIVSEREGRQRD